jgi:tetratricopeptide (TPR) repeat protein
VGPLRLGDAPIQPLSDASLKTLEWLRGVTVGGYDRVGKRNPKWDDDARQALALGTELWGSPGPHMGIDRSLFETSQRAVEAGCDDPLVLYMYARTFRNFGKDPAKTIALHQRAADALWDSGYSSYHRSLAQFRIAQLHLEQCAERKKAGGGDAAEEAFRAGVERVNKATGLLDDLAKEKDVPIDRWVDLGDALQAAFKSVLGPTQAVERALPHFERTAPKIAYLTIKGEFYTKWAWQARGGGFAGTVTPEGWKTMADRLAVAQAALEEAWTLDPTNCDAATRMLTVELGQGQGRDRMELWFKRAIEANPDNNRAYNDKLYYLEPKWHGSPEEMLKFGRECVKQGRFLTKVPMTLESAHEALSHYTHGGWVRESDLNYYKNPAVWADLKAVYDGYLRADKGADLEYMRNRYAYLARLCEAWGDADKIFTVIGDHRDSRIWTAEKFDAARKEAAEKAGK